MARAVVTLQKCVVDSQEFGSDDEHMVSRVFFHIDVEGKESDSFVDLKQAVGSSFETGPLEVSKPRGRGPWNHQEFSRQVESYYRSCVGAQGRGFRIGPGASNIRLQNCVVSTVKTFEFEVNGPNASW